MTDISNEQSFALIVTAGGWLEIELGPKFGETDVEVMLVAVVAVAEAVHHAV